jgi:hypothetical protein
MRLNKGICHKCHKPVPMEDDKGILLAIINDSPIEAYLTQTQHLSPTDTCPGSPSIAQYLTGEADLRTDSTGALLYPVDPDMVEMVKKAYLTLRVRAALHRGTPPLNKD